MKLGDIKAQAISLMFVNTTEEIAHDNLLDHVDDDTYGYYLVRMPEAINRAFSAIERARVLPVRSQELIAAAGAETLRGVRFDLGTLISDYYDVERVVKETRASYETVTDYFREGDAIVIEGFDTAAMYRLLYRPSIRRIGAGTSDDYEVSEIPDRIACYLPYAIKAEIFRNDDPDEADVCRVIFETALSAIAMEEKTSRQGRVRTVYGGGLMV
jgi:hypothetical protein